MTTTENPAVTPYAVIKAAYEADISFRRKKLDAEDPAGADARATEYAANIAEYEATYGPFIYNPPRSSDPCLKAAKAAIGAPFAEEAANFAHQCIIRQTSLRACSHKIVQHGNG